jgi:3-deoxy-D-manno-octulosonate 8-phosphate phosphatase (KDO 8-P phosphatase)
MHIKHVYKGCREKAVALREFSNATGVGLEEICFIGDDVNDLPAMEIAGFAAAPSDAARDVLSLVDFVSKHTGGNGAVREFIETVLRARDLHAPDLFLEKPTLSPPAQDQSRNSR